MKALSAGKFWLPDFSPEMTFVVHAWPAGMTVRGRHPKRGEVFDKTQVTVQQLKRLYLDRWIASVEPIDPPADIAKAIEPPSDGAIYAAISKRDNPPEDEDDIAKIIAEANAKAQQLQEPRQQRGKHRGLQNSR